MPKTIITYAGYEATFTLKKYAKPQNIHMQLWCEDGPLATASINPDTLLNDDEIAIKSYSENEGLLEVLEAAGVVKRTGEMVQAGNMRVPVCKLLKTE